MTDEPRDESTVIRIVRQALRLLFCRRSDHGVFLARRCDLVEPWFPLENRPYQTQWRFDRPVHSLSDGHVACQFGALAHYAAVEIQFLDRVTSSGRQFFWLI